MQVLRVRRDALAAGSTKINVPHPDERKQHRHIGVKRRSRKVLIHRVRARE